MFVDGWVPDECKLLTEVIIDRSVGDVLVEDEGVEEPDVAGEEDCCDDEDDVDDMTRREYRLQKNSNRLRIFSITSPLTGISLKLVTNATTTSCMF